MFGLLFEMSMAVLESILNGVILLFPLWMGAYMDRHHRKYTRNH